VSSPSSKNDKNRSLQGLRRAQVCLPGTFECSLQVLGQPIEADAAMQEPRLRMAK
jgi:hypothetical protein